MPHILPKSNDTSVGEVVRISCEVGYTLQWLPSMTSSAPSDVSYTSGDVISASIADYRTNLTDSVICTPSGEWFPNNFTCERKCVIMYEYY